MGFTNLVQWGNLTSHPGGAAMRRMWAGDMLRRVPLPRHAVISACIGRPWGGNLMHVDASENDH